MTENEKIEIKKLFETGNYICIYYVLHDTNQEWNKITYPSWNWNSYEYKLIHKDHRDILKAYLENPEVSICVKYQGLSKVNFIKEYDEDYNYVLAEPDLRSILTLPYKVEKSVGGIPNVNIALDSDISVDISETDIVCEKCKVVTNFHQEEGLIKCQSCGEEWYTQEYYEKNREGLLTGLEGCLFEKYGFHEPEFEGKILWKESNIFYGFIYNGTRNICISWNQEGKVYDCLDTNFKSFDLKPLEKPWYEKEENLGKFVFCEDILCIFQKLKTPKIATLIEVGTGSTFSANVDMICTADLHNLENFIIED